MKIIRKYSGILLLMTVTACTKQTYFEGLKAGRQAQCLEYPVSEYENCVDEIETGFEEYRTKREEIVGKQPGLL